MTSATIDNKALLVAPRDAKAPASATMVSVARAHGLSPIAQMRQMIALRFGPGKIAQPEYYAYGLFDPDLTPERKKEFVGRTGSWEINDRLNPAKLTGSRVFVADKVMYTALLRQLGLPTTETQGVASQTRNFGNIPALRDPAALQAFLCDQARFPLFGKPCEGRGSVGSAMLTGIEDGQIVMGNGHRADLAGFCAEVFADYPEGFIFQTALTQHQTLAVVAGSAIGTMRVITVRDTDTPRVLYTVWKIPSPDAMSDNFWQSGSMIAQVDAHGQVGACKIGTGLDARFIETHPVSGVRFDMVQVPQWDAVQQVASEAHALFPEFGIIGWDMAITPDGPVIIEANDNPYHALWQLPEGRGILNSDFNPVFDKAAEKSQAILQGKIDMFKIRQRAKGRRA
jgi:putative polysaccharide biosynthesis protein